MKSLNDNMGQTVSSQTNFFNKRLNTKVEICINLWKDAWKGNVGRTVLPLGQNLLEILKKYNNEPYMFFLNGQYGSARIVADSNF